MDSRMDASAAFSFKTFQFQIHPITGVGIFAEIRLNDRIALGVGVLIGEIFLLVVFRMIVRIDRRVKESESLPLRQLKSADTYLLLRSNFVSTGRSTEQVFEVDITRQLVRPHPGYILRRIH